MLTPVLRVCIDEVLARLSNSGALYHVGHHYARARGFADDVALTGSSATVTRLMLR